MSIRNISYTVSAAGISPSNSVFGGTQRDDNPTRVDFHIDGALASALVSEAEEKSGTVYYRFDVYDGDGNIIRVESEELGNKSTVSLPLTENITRNGGRITVYLVFTIIRVTGEGEDKTELNLFSFPAHLSLNNLPNAYTEGDHNARESLTTLEEAAKRAAANALLSETNSKASENSVRADRERVETAKEIFENASWVFDGNGGRDEEDPKIDIHYAVDDTISSSSTNALQNRAIYNALVAWKNEILAQAKLDAHPLWSLYWNMDKTITKAEANNPNSPKHPHTLFGGTWERITDKFILAAGGEHKINDYPIISPEAGGLKPKSVKITIGGQTFVDLSFTHHDGENKYCAAFPSNVSYDNKTLTSVGFGWWYGEYSDEYETHHPGTISLSGWQGESWYRIIPDEDVEIIMSDHSSYVITVADFRKWANEDNTYLTAQNLWTGKGGTAKHNDSKDEMPNHQHGIAAEGVGGTLLYYNASGDNTGSIISVTPTTNGAYPFISVPQGNSQPHNNMPPYETAYCWVRVPDPPSNN